MIFVYFVLVFGLIIVIHELGHLFAAKAFNVYCDEFAFGMGPQLIKKKFKETTYSIRLLPIGGFVAMAGEADASFDQSEIPFERTLKGISKWKQIIIMLAGVFFNFVLGLIFFIGINLIIGQRQLPTQPIISEVEVNSPADKAGLLANDEIIKVIYPKNTEVKVNTFNDIGTYFELFADEEITFVIKRGSEQLDVLITPKYNEEYDRYLIGISGVAGEIIDLTFLDAVKEGFKDFANGTTLIIKSLGFLFKGIGLNHVSGPIGIIDQTDQLMSTASSFKEGILTLMNLIAIFSVNLGIFNLIPLPMFDGGRVVLTLYEIITRKDINKKVEMALMTASLLVVVLLLLLTTFNDVTRLIFR